MAKLHLGLSGYDYRDWQGDGLFYPPAIRRANYLEHYATRMNSLESIGTFRRNPSEATVQKWVASTPADFTFSPRMVQSVSHFMRLSGNAVNAARRFLSFLEPLETIGKLGSVSLHIPEDLDRNDELLAGFLDAMPRRSTLRWAIEFRNDTWHAAEVEEILRARNVAWIAAEFDDAPAEIRDTASFVYIRLRRLDYSDEQLQDWAGMVNEKLASGKDCFVYCRHLETIAPWTWADRLRELVEGLATSQDESPQYS